MLVHSRLEMINPEIRFILKDRNPSMHMQTVSSSDGRLFMHFVHPDPPNTKYATETTERVAELLIVVRKVEKRDQPTTLQSTCTISHGSSPRTYFRTPSACSERASGKYLQRG